MPRSGALKERPPEPLTSPLTQMGSGESSGASGDKDHLYSTVCKPRSPKPAAPAAPPFSSSCGVLGTGLCELDRLLQELNATQFNITDEIMSQFPSSKETAGEQKEDQSEDKRRPSLPPSPSPVLPKPSATSATLELDRLMASLSDFRVQNHLPASGPTQPPVPSSVNEGSPSPPGPAGKGSLDTMLGLLQSDLSRRGVPTQAKGLCGSCNKPIAGQVVTALGRAWHPEHFVCGGCSTALGGSSFFEKDGAPFCPECYFERFSPRCGLCNQPIRHKMVTALGTHWHPEHFCCVSCGEPFGDEGESLTPTLKAAGPLDIPPCSLWASALRPPKSSGPRIFSCSLLAPTCPTCVFPSHPFPLCFRPRPHPSRPTASPGPIASDFVGLLVPPRTLFLPPTRFPLLGFHEREGRPYCRRDFLQLFAPRCQGCQGPILDNYISALSALWHPDCFVCRECFAPFSGGSFFEHEGRPLCENHFHARRGSLCATCGLPVTGRCVSALGRRFHPDHFTCTFCLRPLTKGSFQERAGKPYCQPCFLKLFG
ncbi:transforming growth factor beta-1-induced transcript 1 protein isoform X2 [Monodon monoceros]|nr:transforming growth factor beta-1-induced transcript 1 protein isoform X2 [Monodon monoceros]